MSLVSPYKGPTIHIMPVTKKMKVVLAFRFQGAASKFFDTEIIFCSLKFWRDQNQRDVNCRRKNINAILYWTVSKTKNFTVTVAEPEPVGAEVFFGLEPEPI